MSKNSAGKRLSFEIHQIEGGELLVSRKIFTDVAGTKMVRIHLNKEEMTWAIVDAVTGASYVDGGDNITNFEVLQRAAKRNLKKLLGVTFEKEVRNAGRFKKTDEQK